jgi:hypothetical protein
VSDIVAAKDAATDGTIGGFAVRSHRVRPESTLAQDLRFLGGELGVSQSPAGMEVRQRLQIAHLVGGPGTRCAPRGPLNDRPPLVNLLGRELCLKTMQLVAIAGDSCIPDGGQNVTCR